MSINPRTTTILFTDLESSTPLWDNHPALMESLVARHDILIREAIEVHRGQVVKTTGDGFLAVFDAASDGITAALAGQRMLIEETWPAETGPLRVRMGLHTGESQEREGDYFGSEVNRAARVMGLAHGGQILVSQATAALLRTALPQDVSLIDLGQHQLKGLKEVEQIYQLDHPDLPGDFPPLDSSAAGTQNLPVQTTPFVGRRQELASVSKLLSDPDVRLLTVLGPGGMGKTRLAVEAAGEQAGSFADGVYFIDLAPIEEAASISSNIADTLAFQFHLRKNREEWTEDTQVNQLLAYLKEKRLLLLLDNCEHLLEPALDYIPSRARSIDQLAAAIIQTAPQVKILATSREQLKLYGETVLQLGGLGLPDSANIDLIDLPDPAADAIKLFLNGAQRVRPDFELGEDNLEDVVDVCRLVGGMPLAIELAAAWIELLSPSEITAEIRKSFEILETDLSGIPDRQRSVRVVFESTWGRLTPVEQETFQQLSVFRGGFTREAAQAVTDASLRTLMGLVNKSLLRPVAEGRYQVHELLRQFAAERLAEDAEVHAAVKDRHSNYYATYLLNAEPELGGQNPGEALTGIGLEFENVRSAWRWAVAHDRTEDIERAQESLCEYLRIRGRLDEPGDFFQPAARALGWEGYGEREETFDSDAMFDEMVHLLAAAESGEKDQDERALLLGKLLARDNRHWCESPRAHWAASSCRRQSMELLSQFGERLEIAWLLRYGAHYQLKPWHSKALYEQALDIFEEFGNERGIAGVRLQLAVLALKLGNYQEAEQLLQDMLARVQEIGTSEAIADLLGLSGQVHWALGNYGSAREFCQQCISLLKEIGYPSMTAQYKRLLARIALSEGDPQTAERYLQEALDIYEECGLLGWRSVTLGELGLVLVSSGEYASAVQLAEESLRICREQEFRSGVIEPLIVLGEAALGMNEIEAAETHFRQAIRKAADTWHTPEGNHALVGLARLLAIRGDTEGAYRLGSFVLANSASWQWSKDNAADLLAEIKGELPPESISAAREWGVEKRFEEIAGHYLPAEIIRK